MPLQGFKAPEETVPVAHTCGNVPNFAGAVGQHMLNYGVVIQLQHAMYVCGRLHAARQTFKHTHTHTRAVQAVYPQSHLIYETQAFASRDQWLGYIDVKCTHPRHMQQR